MIETGVVATVREGVLAWYAEERRSFPWRGVEDPYAVLVSEVMLQQTQASRVAERFPRFLARFPDPVALAAAAPGEVLAEWSGLGYNRRALALQRAAVVVARDGWPSDVAGLERLPGIGPYTARAVASLAFGLPVGVVDTNVRRWLLRRFGGPDEPRRLQALSDALASPGRGGAAADWTHASMEIGAAVCRSRSPRCDVCPLAADCPSRAAPAVVEVPRQAPLRGSDRAYRGAIVKELAALESRAAPERAVRRRLERQAARIGPSLDADDWERIIAGLERDRMVHRRAGSLRLGAATIEP
jgi:A/G-specific adenine glycosylase